MHPPLGKWRRTRYSTSSLEGTRRFKKKRYGPPPQMGIHNCSSAILSFNKTINIVTMQQLSLLTSSCDRIIFVTGTAICDVDGCEKWTSNLTSSGPFDHLKDVRTLGKDIDKVCKTNAIISASIGGCF